jgi:carboxymethylenebutenolidase
MNLHAHQTYVIEEFAEDYLNHRLDRRNLLRRVLMVTGSVPLTASMLLALGCGDSVKDEAPKATATVSAPAATPTLAAGTGPGVAETDPQIEARDVTFPGPASPVKAYLARPKGTGTYPAVLIVHENAGLQPHFKDVARRFAKEGFVGLAIDLVSRLGGTSDDAARNMQALRLSPDDLNADTQAGFDYLKTQSFVKANAMGVTGFCFGGGIALEMAGKSPDVKASVPYYGFTTPALTEILAKMAPPILYLVGDQDNLSKSLPDLETKVKAGGRTFESKVYPGAMHAFFNEGRPSYNKDASVDAWPRTLAWFRKYLVG